MLINVDDLMSKNLDLAYAERPEAFDALSKIKSDSGVEFTGPIRFDLKAYRVGELIVIDGHFTAPVRFSCVRCLSEFETDLTAAFKLTYCRESDSADRKPDEAEVALKADEIGLIRFSGLHIDLRPALQEELIMALPMRPLCKESCKGLCPRCGANLNEGDCACLRQKGHPGFAVLKNIKK
jgi:uncharacterized protein